MLILSNNMPIKAEWVLRKISFIQLIWQTPDKSELLTIEANSVIMFTIQKRILIINAPVTFSDPLVYFRVSVDAPEVGSA